ncbi:hypothetical protein BDQ12DRAFT_665170 [Crucibulum laeve]|uniref:F-box domain-containing protein n=1 Tax=Crucibulum laeve TaxID=68775 RepID=A0A5C3M3I5_9AGAR|nr:hypothetical protein BDQ12DRAFT_665170 [Crucibulum laeve]
MPSSSFITPLYIPRSTARQYASHIVLAILKFDSHKSAVIGIISSQNLPLNLTCDFRLKDFLVQQGHFAEVFHMILLASARWSRVSIRFDERYGTEITNKLNGLNVPLLEYFQFTSSSYSVNDVNLLRDAHSLKKLQLSCASLRDFKNVLHGITSLYLTAHYPMTFQEFRDTILLIPHLTELSMLRCNIDNWPSLPSSDDIIPLPSLSTLEFADRRYTLFYPLLWISAPGLQTITLHDIVDHDLPQSTTIPLLLQNFPAVRKLVLQGSASFLEEASFMELNSIFPMLDHVAIVLSQELFVEQFTYAMLETTLWPRLRSVTMNPPASENSISNMIAVRAISKIPLGRLVIPPSQFVRIDWLNQQVKVEVCDMPY